MVTRTPLRATDARAERDGARSGPLLVLAAWLGTEPLAAPLYEAVERGLLGAVAGVVPARLAELIADVSSLDRLVIGALVLVSGTRILRRRRPLPKLGALELAMGVLTLLLGANVLLLSHNQDHALRTLGDAFVFPFLLYLVVRCLVTGPEAFRAFHAAVVLLGVGLVVAGLAERFGIATAMHRLRGPFEDQIVLGVVVVVAFFVIASRLPDGVRSATLVTPLRFGFELGLHLLPAIAFFTLNRSVWLGFLAGLAALALAPRGRSRRERRALAAALGASAVVVIAWGLSGVPRHSPRRAERPLPAAAARQEPLASRRASARELMDDLIDRRLLNTRTLEYRMGAWTALVEGLPDHLFFGFGLNNSPEYLAARLEPGSGRRRAAPLHPHSAYLAMLAETGLAGLASILAIHASILVLGLRLARRGESDSLRWIGACLAAAAIAYLLPGLLSNSFYRPVFANHLFFAYTGAVAGLADRRVGAVEGKDRPAAAPKPSSPGA